MSDDLSQAEAHACFGCTSKVGKYVTSSYRIEQRGRLSTGRVFLGLVGRMVALHQGATALIRAVGP